MRFLIFIMVALMTVPTFAKGKPRATGDDLFPWPWGTECPFPWQNIEGTYLVDAPKGTPYYNHLLFFRVEEDRGQDLKFLTIMQFDPNGELFAEGKGYSQKNTRLVKGILTPELGERDYSVIVRSYVRNSRGGGCKVENMVTAVTFCPLRGRRCLENSNYEIKKLNY